MASTLQTIFLDFDGVLFDTVREAYAVAMISQQQYDKIDDVDFFTPHYALFRKFRYLIAPAWNYLYLLHALDHCTEQNMERCYEQLLEKTSPDDFTAFEKKFFNTRKNLIETDYEKWLALNQSTSFMQRVSDILVKHYRQCYIITTKDKFTVMQLLHTVGVSFSEKHIFDKEDFNKKDKGTIISDIMKENGTKEALFIDDSRKHLNACQGIENLKLLQPDWGYHKPGDKTLDENEILSQIKETLGEP